MTSRTSSYKAGAASVCITPDEPLWLAGYASRTAPARGTISDLFASALAIEDALENRFVLVSVDLIAVTPIIADQVLEAVRSQHGLERHQVMLVASHTHYGPEFRPDKQTFFNIPDDYAAKLPMVAQNVADAMIDAIRSALSRLEPVRMFVRSTTAGFAHNRRRHGVKDGNASVEDVVEHDVPVLDCINAEGQRQAIVFGYACHNTTIPADDGRYCADWAGFAREELQRQNPGAVVLFVPGAGGDQDPEPASSVQLSRVHGQELAESIQTVLGDQRDALAGTILTELDNVELPIAAVTEQQLLAMLESDDRPQRVKARFLSELLERGEKQISSYRAPIQAVRLGNEFLLLGLSGEPVVDWTRIVKEQVLSTQNKLGTPSPSMVWVAGYCNDMFGYLPTQRVQAEGGYEGGRSYLWNWIPGPLTEDAEGVIIEAVRSLISRTETPESA